MHRLVLRELLNPRQWRAPEDRKFHLDAEQINELCDAAERIFKDEPSVLRLRGKFTQSLLLQDGYCRSALPAKLLVNALCHMVCSVVTPVHAAPIKIFGDLHGQFGDLMRLFEEYGTPSTAGDITYIDYLFLGMHQLPWPTRFCAV